ncbi:MAG: hypothetical protein OXQ86_11315 [Gammaproteobacteria bacterium]|nr:hypothetical protein [Gammaproteobacteria bacterium]MDE0415255.1 hypothetical protein [Gammaproteobacteria bacterium]
MSEGIPYLSPVSTVPDNEYRRGAVLGLTVAEVFILLLFLLLLVFLGLERSWKNQSAELRVQLKDAQNRLAPFREWEQVIEEFKAPEEIVTLRRQQQAAVQAAQNYRRENEVLRKIVDQGDSGQQEAARLASELRQAEETLQEAQQIADNFKEELRVLRVKGLNPPCWYEPVPDGKGGTREKPHYTLSVGVFDNYMMMMPLEAPLGGAADDNGGTYAAEAERLGLMELSYGVPLEDSQIVQELQPFHSAGKGQRVRTYPCIFWVRVWDKTSPSSKVRWQRAHDQILEGLFGAYTVKEDPWPGPS